MLFWQPSRRDAAAALRLFQGSRDGASRFFRKSGAGPRSALWRRSPAPARPGADPGLLIHDVKGWPTPVRGDVTFLDNRKYLRLLAATRASACLVAPAFASRVPEGTAVVMAQPYRGFALALQLLYPDAMFPRRPWRAPASRRSIRAPGWRRM